MRFGTEHLTTTLDDDGSTLRISKKIHDFKEISSNKRFEYRIRVTNDKEELEQYLKFQQEKVGKLDPEFKIEHNKTGNEQGYYYIVKCWTVLGDGL